MSKDRVFIFDTTLRDGAQTQGVDFSVEDKINILKKLRLYMFRTNVWYYISINYTRQKYDGKVSAFDLRYCSDCFIEVR